MYGWWTYALPVARTVASATCRAPHVALRFSPDGRVHACCVNERHQLGRIGERSIQEIWEGTPLAELRAALDAGDWSLGCQDCGLVATKGHRQETHAEQFDRFDHPAEPSWPRRMEFALSNTCNLQCVQCSGDLSSAIRAQREHRPPLRSPYGDAFFEELRTFLPHVEVAVFIGGEPFLAREARRVWDLLIEMDLHPEVHVTTNGTVWNDEVERYLHALAMNVCVSLDGTTAEVNESIRLGTDHREVLANRDRFREATRSYGAALGINHCLMVQNWSGLGDLLVEADALDADVNVIPVVYPPAMSVLSLPADDLAEVLAALEAQDRDLAPRLTRNRAAWDGVLGQLRATVESAGTPVAIGPAPTLGGRDDRLLREIREDLAAWGGGDLLVFDTERGIVRHVEADGVWAGLGAAAWLDRPAPVVLDELRRLGPVEDLVLDASPVLRWGSCTVRLNGSGPVAHRLAVVEWHEGHTRWTRTLVARHR